MRGLGDLDPNAEETAMQTKWLIKADVDLGGDGPQVGETWCHCFKVDYGMKSDHERHTGEKHVNISRDGDYPFFTVPVSRLERISDETA
jgi:hypothetical protein